MSLAYDEYLAEHIGNVNKGLHWMLDNLFLSQKEKTAIETAMTEFNHDESKYSTEEYNAYDQYFYGGNRSYKVVQDFNYAWLHHIHQNPHHWQYWVLLEDDPEEEGCDLKYQPGTGEYNAHIGKFPIKTLLIPLPYIFEMIADWWTFSWKEGNLFEIFNWYADHRAKQYIHPESREIIEYILVKIWNILIMQETVAEHDISEIEAQYKRLWMEQDNNTQNYHDLFWESGKPPVPTISHSITEPLGKVINVHETENGLEITVEHSDEEDHLEHHGILGQKWGVRRYQNADGTRTAEGKQREAHTRRTNNALSTVDAVNKIVATLPEQEQLMLGVGRNDKKWIPDDRRKQIASEIAKTFIEYDGDEPVSMLEIWDIGDGKADIALATNPKYRGTGVTSKNIKAAVDWFNSGNNKQFDQLQWNNLKMNPKSGQIAEHYGFGDYDEDDKWEYRRIFKDKPIKHSEPEDDEDLYGVPELKKFPMPDKKHVKSAIRFFNYVDPKYEKELAEAIIEKAEEFGLDLESDISVGDENMFKKYITADDSKESNKDRVLTHYGIKGQTWGERRFQYADGSLTPEGRKRYLKESKLDPSSKKDSKKSDPLFDISKLGKGTYTPPGAPGPDGRVGSVTGAKEPEYDQWEKNLYSEFEKSGINPSNMSDAEFKALLVKKGILKEDAADSLVKTMKQKAMMNYKIYSKKDEPAAAETTTAAADTDDKKSKKSSGESSGGSGRASGGSSGSGSGAKQSQANDISAVKTNEKPSVDSLEKSITSKIEKLSKLKEGAISLGDILSDDMDGFITKLSDLIDDDISGLSYKDLKELRERLQKQYEDSKKDKETENEKEGKEDTEDEEEKKEK